MGLDCSHDAFHGAYSAFNRLRQEVARAVGGSFPPHWKFDEHGDYITDEHGMLVRDTELDDNCWYWDTDFCDKDTHAGLFEFLTHSDCDGEILPAMCILVANDLESILPRIEEMNSVVYGHLARDGGYAAVIRRFITGCRAAAAANEPLRFR